MSGLPQGEAATIRHQLIALLQEEGPLSVRELSQALHQAEKDLYAHLAHIEQSLKKEGLRLAMEPAVCHHCGFVFSNRQRPQPPGRCPVCKRSHIQRPRYAVAAGTRLPHPSRTGRP